MLTNEPEMLQPDAFCEHTMQQNATVAKLCPGSRCMGELTALPRPLAGFKGAAAGRFAAGGERKGREGEERRGEGKWRRGTERKRNGRKGVDSDAQLEQGRRLAKAGPES